MGSCNFKVYIIMRSLQWLSGRKQSGAGGMRVWRASGKMRETLNAPKSRKDGSGEVPHARPQGLRNVQSFRVFPAARRTRIPPAPDCFLGFEGGKFYVLFGYLFAFLFIMQVHMYLVKSSLILDVVCGSVRFLFYSMNINESGVL